MPHSAHFNQECRSCQRLTGFLEDAKQSYPRYHAGSVAPFGGTNTRLPMTDLAPMPAGNYLPAITVDH